MSRLNLYLKMASVGLLFTLGGPALMYYVTPAEGELFQRFSPELQASNLANRERRLRQHEDFVGKLKEYSKSDKPIWEVAKEAARREREEALERERVARGQEERRRAEVRAEAAGQAVGVGAGR